MIPAGHHAVARPYARGEICGRDIVVLREDAAAHVVEHDVCQVVSRRFAVAGELNAIGAADSDNLLEVGEQFEIVITLADLGVPGPLVTPIGINSKFNIQIKPSLGSTITVQRTMPAGFESVMDLH